MATGQSYTGIEAAGTVRLLYGNMLRHAIWFHGGRRVLSARVNRSWQDPGSLVRPPNGSPLLQGCSGDLYAVLSGTS